MFGHLDKPTGQQGCAENRNSVRIRFFLKTNRHRTVQKFDIHSDGFSTETVCKFAIYVKSDKLHICYISGVVANVLANLLLFLLVDTRVKATETN